MPRTIEGRFEGSGRRFAIVAGRFNESVTSKLVEGAVGALVRHGVTDDAIDVAWVPGAFEIPLVARTMAETKNYDAVICVGAVIRGATTHYEIVSGECASGITRASQDTGVPVILGVLTTETIEQAMERAGSKLGNKGFDAAMAALETADLIRKISGRD